MSSKPDRCWDMIASPENKKLEHQYQRQLKSALAQVMSTFEESWVGPSLARATSAVITDLVFQNALAWGESMNKLDGADVEEETWKMAAAMQKLFAKMLEWHIKRHFLVAGRDSRGATR